MLQTMAGALTAITVTYLMSFLGVAGTIIGVGLVSVLTVLGNFMYASAIHSAKERVKHAQPKVRKRAQRPGRVETDVSTPQPEEISAMKTPDATGQPVTPTGGESVSVGSTEAEGVAAGTARPGHGEPERGYPDSPDGSSPPGRWRRAWTTMLQRYGRRKVFGSIALVFVLLAGTVTVIELSVGQPLSDIVRNEDSSGTTFFGGAGGDGDDAETEDEGTNELPPPQDDDVVEEPPAPEAPQEGDLEGPEAPQDQGPVEEPQQEEQPAPEEGAPGQ